eukprot:COSAG04_NODE_384_length_15390_cov_64.570158_4_plen_190_part_00
MARGAAQRQHVSGGRGGWSAGSGNHWRGGYCLKVGQSAIIEKRSHNESHWAMSTWAILDHMWQLGTLVLLCTRTGSSRRANGDNLASCHQRHLQHQRHRRGQSFPMKRRKNRLQTGMLRLETSPIFSPRASPNPLQRPWPGRTRKGKEGRPGQQPRRKWRRYMEVSLKRAVPAERWKWQLFLGKAISRS